MDRGPLGGGAVGTCEYSPTATEKTFYDRLNEADRTTFHSKPSDEGEKSAFTLRGHNGKFVSWFGVVRDIKRNANNSGAILLIQNTYFSGVTDCHIQTVEINGAGDFEIELSELPEELIPLVLVRVYGIVSRESDGRPVVKADFVRVWHFGQYNFMDFGEDHSNPEWRKRIKLPPGERIYHIGASAKYYAERLGPTTEQREEIAAFHRGQTEFDFEYEGLPPLETSAIYKPTEWEQPYFDRLRKEDRITVQSKFFETEHATFQLPGHVKQFVSWFGIVREATPRPGKRGGILLVENKYFKGSGDEKLQTVSIRGGGSFKAEVTKLSEELQPLMLVRIYGGVLREEGGMPIVGVTYLRGWHLGQFNFDDYGADRSDSRWTKNVHLGWRERVHENQVSADYYIKRLGPTSEQAQMITKYFEWQKECEKQQKEATQEMESRK